MAVMAEAAAAGEDEAATKVYPARKFSTALPAILIGGRERSIKGARFVPNQTQASSNFLPYRLGSPLYTIAAHLSCRFLGSANMALILPNMALSLL